MINTTGINTHRRMINKLLVGLGFTAINYFNNELLERTIGRNIKS